MAIVINGDEVKVGDIWELRNGRTLVTITWVDESLTWCIKAHNDIPITWDKNGLCRVSGVEHEEDLVKLIRRAEIVEDKLVEDEQIEGSTYTPKEQVILKRRFDDNIDALSYVAMPQSVATIEQFKKFDTNKPRYSLIDPDWQEDVAKVLTMGAQKYDANNWKLCEDPERYIDALIRHLEDIRRGKFKDKESKLQHTAHISCNAMFLHWMIKNGVMK